MTMPARDDAQPPPKRPHRLHVVPRAPRWQTPECLWPAARTELCTRTTCRHHLGADDDTSGPTTRNPEERAARVSENGIACALDVSAAVQGYGLTTETIGSLLGMARQGVEIVLARAVQKLRKSEEAEKLWRLFADAPDESALAPCTQTEMHTIEQAAPDIELPALSRGDPFSSEDYQQRVRATLSVRAVCSVRQLCDLTAGRTQRIGRALRQLVSGGEVIYTQGKYRMARESVSRNVALRRRTRVELTRMAQLNPARDEIQAGVRRVLQEHGVKHGSRMLDVAPVTATRLAAGLPVARGTELVVAEALREMTEQDPAAAS